MQLTFGDAEGMGKRKKTRREIFLAEMERVVPWAGLLALIEPHYPTMGRPGRQPYALATMLRIHFLQQWYALSDPAMEEALIDTAVMRRFARLNGLDNIPDETTILNFRRLLEDHGLSQSIFERVNAHLARKGQSLRAGTIVDATIIAAPSSTKNHDGERDPEMHQTKKGNQWHFGMKAHIGVDAASGLIHTVIGTAANVSDLDCAAQALHGEEKAAYVDAGYTGVEKRAEVIAKRPEVQWVVAQKRGKVKALPEGVIKQLTRQLEKLKAQVRARVEHPFHLVKNLFKFRKVRYRGLAENT
ncbi:MAG TPA: IS5 family transposase, partial [Xanthomonadaceae bacterium]|nr:IS5 family transposase [Xanthomonadaceae bacterium]